MLFNFNLSLLGLFFLRPGDLYFQHAVFKPGFYQIGLNVVVECKRALKSTVAAFLAVISFLIDFSFGKPFTSEG
jgi:hypothetical protein